jgi:hypothetical protein
LNDLAGFALASTGIINKGQPTAILIGAPGFSNNAGTVYLIPGRAGGLSGVFPLTGAESAPLSGIQFLLSTPASPAGSPSFFGASVSSRVQGTQINTVDLDDEADFVAGAPGYDVTQNTAGALAGGAFILQSGFLQVPIPASTVVTTMIGVNTPFAPFAVNATTPTTVQIFVFGSTSVTPNFMPVTDINPATIVVNGVAFPNATITEDPTEADHIPDGIPDAIITISPVSALALPSGTTTITITGAMLSTSPLAGDTFTGTATVTVTGGTGGGGGSSSSGAGVAAAATGPVLETQFVSPFGANQFTPSLTAFSALNYAPLPLSVAINEYLPPTGFRARLYAFDHPGKKVGTSRGQNQGRASGINTLASGVFSRGVFHPQRIFTIKHKTAKIGIVSGVVPIKERVETFDDNLLH